jgi:hypothetical protein
VGPPQTRHPWRDAALAASMPLGPLHETCAPAGKSRNLWRPNFLRMKIKINGNGNGNGIASKLPPTIEICVVL